MRNYDCYRAHYKPKKGPTPEKKNNKTKRRIYCTDGN